MLPRAPEQSRFPVSHKKTFVTVFSTIIDAEKYVSLGVQDSKTPERKADTTHSTTSDSTMRQSGHMEETSTERVESLGSMSLAQPAHTSHVAGLS